MDKGKFQKVCSIIGAHFVFAPLSMFWIYGNLSAYMDSYFVFSCSPKCLDGESQWILCVFGAGQLPGMFLATPLIQRIGVKWTAIISMLIGSLGLLSSAWSLHVSVVGTAAIFGLLVGPSAGIASVVSIQVVSVWAPQWAGLLGATASSFATLLSVVQNQIITAYVNPSNLKANAAIGPRTYFSQSQVLDRVPGAVIIIAATMTGLQLIGSVLVSNPPKHTHDVPGSDAMPEISTKVEDIDNEPLKRSREFDSETNYSSHSPNLSTTSGIHSIKQNQHSANGTSKRHANGSITESKDKSSKDAPISWKPFEVLLSPAFYSVFLFEMSIDYGLLLKSNFYKQFGQIYIHNDQYLTLIGTLVPVVSTCSRIIFGTVLDRGILSLKDIMILGLFLNSALCSIWYMVPQWSGVLYMFHVLGLAFAQSLFYVVMPCAALRLFGPDHLTTNFGLTFISMFITSILTPVVTTSLLHTLGWFWLFTSCSIINLFSLCFVIATSFNTQSRA